MHIQHIPRHYDNLSKYIKPSKVLVIYGPRQIGKTTLLQNFLNSAPAKYKLDSGENIELQEIFIHKSLRKLKEYVAGYNLLVIDEAQKIHNIGSGLKLLIDNCPNLSIVVTGSSSFDLAGQIGEPLTGRKKSLVLYPIAQLEMQNLFNDFELNKKLPECLIFGGYPEVILANDKSDKKDIITEIMQSYLLKDLLELERIKNSKFILNLLRLLAYQIGNEVSLTEIGQQIGLDYKTIARYLDILEKSFIIISLGGFSRNLRNEITKKNKYYFYDTGIRNAIIANFNEVEIRNDIGQLWENFLIVERLKKQAYHRIHANNYFWRTWEKQEIDWVEERDGKLFGYEFKWNNKKLVKVPAQWTSTYADSEFKVINPDNYFEFIN